jgi:hypothetical protein
MVLMFAGNGYVEGELLQTEGIHMSSAIHQVVSLQHESCGVADNNHSILQRAADHPATQPTHDASNCGTALVLDQPKEGHCTFDMDVDMSFDDYFVGHNSCDAAAATGLQQEQMGADYSPPHEVDDGEGHLRQMSASQCDCIDKDADSWRMHDLQVMHSP